MKRFLFFVISAILLFACTPKTEVETTFNQELSVFASTKANEPLEGTIWEHETGDEFNKYIYFHDGKANFFYGKITDNLERWSEFYSADYNLNDGEVTTKIVYPFWGQKELVNTITVIKAGKDFTIEANGEEYKLTRHPAEDIDGMWMIITVNIAPWIE